MSRPENLNSVGSEISIEPLTMIKESYYTGIIDYNTYLSIHYIDSHIEEPDQNLFQRYKGYHYVPHKHFSIVYHRIWWIRFKKYCEQIESW